MSRMVNAFSIDLEDWFCAHNLEQVISRAEWDKQELRIIPNTMRLLELLARHKVTATFFVLGWVATRFPALVAEIERKGHEIATHGYSHRLLTDMTPKSFDEDLREALEATQRCVRQRIVGFRAPSFSITEKTLWAFTILGKHGIGYDSSIFPIAHHPDYGMPKSPLGIHRIGDSLIEFPLSCVEILGQRVPCGGGGYFRLCPYNLTRFLVDRCNELGRPLMFFVHPWEIDADQPRVRLPWTKAFRHYHNLDRTWGRLERLLSDFRFTSTRDVLGM